MCSQAEADLRQSLGTLSTFEIACPHHYDPRKVVKEYCRGEETRPFLRSPEILRKTTDYLFEHILEGPDFLQRYAFLSDRLRAVEKDYRVINRAGEGVWDLERIARFHLLAAWEGQKYAEFPVELNWKRLKDLLELLEETYTQVCSASQGEFAVYRVLLCLNSPVSVCMFLKSADIDMRRQPLFQLALQGVRYYYTNNYTALYRLASSSPCLVQVLLTHQLRCLDLQPLLLASYRGSPPSLPQLDPTVQCLLGNRLEVVGTRLST